MAIKFIPVTCPKCGADLSIEEYRKEAFCTYCGTKIIIQNENEHIIRHIDEAALKREEVNESIRLKELEIQMVERKARLKRESISTKLRWGMIGVGVLLMVIGFLFENAIGLASVGFFILSMSLVFMVGADAKREEDSLPSDIVRVPNAISDFESKDYITVESIMRGAGFKNVSCVALNDLLMGVFTKPGKVESITINGSEVTSGGKKFPKDATVLITYHSLRE